MKMYCNETNINRMWLNQVDKHIGPTIAVSPNCSRDMPCFYRVLRIHP